MHGQYQEWTRAFLWTLVTLEVAAETSVSPGKPIGQEYGCSGQDPQQTQASQVPSKQQCAFQQPCAYYGL